MATLTSDKTEKICQAALRLFTARGYAETNVPSIAKAAGVGVGTLYRYFKNKEGIFNTLFQQVLRHFLDELEIRVQPSDSVQDQYSQLFDASATLLINYSAELHFVSLNAFNEVLDSTSREAREKVITYFTDFLKNGQRQAVFTKADPDTLLVLLYGSVEMMASQLWIKHELYSDPAAETRLVHQMKNLLWNALTVERKVFVEEV